MSQRINISVPDDLYQKLQTFKERLSMSKICQDALLRAIHIEEMRSQVEEDIEQLAKVFAAQRKEYHQEFFEKGFKNGMQDAFQSDYETMAEVAYDVYIRDEPTVKIFEHWARKDTAAELASSTSDFWFNSASYLQDDAREFYVTGWLEGFLDVWERVCKKLGIHDFKKKGDA